MNKDIKRLLADDSAENRILLEELEKAIVEMEGELSVQCDIEGIIGDEVKRLVKSGGKRLRPVLAYLGYEVGRSDPERNESEYPIIPLMCTTELIHTSSLIHDDIVDKAQVRRGVPTINATKGDFIAAQAGDLLLARAAELAKHYKGIDADMQFSKIAEQMCIAEFMQIDNAYKYDENSLNNYFAQIERKTAAFISAAVAIGGLVGGASEKTKESLRKYGTNAGIAFQLRDDLLDFCSDDSFGKKCGQDVKSGLLTFPLICALDKDKDKEMINVVVSKEKSDDDINRLLEYVKGSEALSKAGDEINRFTKAAVDSLKDINESPAKDMLIRLAGGLAVRNV